MVNSISDVLSELDFYELHQIFLNSNYYEFLFPFLLAYAILYTVLSRIKFFKSKKTGEPIKSVVVIVALIVSFFGISFEISPGENVGTLMMVLFPNISALTIGILTLYLVGSIMGKNFFRDLFDKDHSAYMYLAVGIIGLASVIFYVGISMDFWDYDPLNFESLWNVVFAVAFLIMGVVFLFINMVSIGVLFLLVFGAFVYNYGQGNFLEYFIDPVVFIIFLFIILISWISADKKDGKERLEEKIASNEKFMNDYRKKYPKGDSVIKDIVDVNLKRNKDKLKKGKW